MNNDMIIHVQLFISNHLIFIGFKLQEQAAHDIDDLLQRDPEADFQCVGFLGNRSSIGAILSCVEDIVDQTLLIRPSSTLYNGRFQRWVDKYG